MTFSHLVKFDNDTRDRLLMFASIAKTVRGIHTVDVSHSRERNDDYRRVYVNGTPVAARIVKGFLLATDFGSIDQNADHDHDECIRSAQSMGVPPSWAHTPETYLSM